MANRKYYVIVVDYFMWDEKAEDIYTEKLYMYTTRDKKRIYVFNSELNDLHYDLKWFETEEDAKHYIKTQKVFKNPSSFENPRVERIDY